MNLKERFANWVLKSVSMTDKESLWKTFGASWEATKPGGNTGYVGACVDTMGRVFSKANFRLYKKQKGILTEVFEHPFLDLMEKPNDFQRWWEVKYFIGAYFAVKGNFYLLKLNNLAGKLTSVVMLDPMRMKPVSSKETGKWIDHYEYDRGDKKLTLQPEEVIHLRMPTTNSLTQGAPIIDRIADVLDVDKYQMKYMKKFFDKGGFMGAVFSTSATLTTQAFKRALEQLKQNYSGTENAFEIALFEQGLQPIKSAYSIRDLELTDSRKLTLEEVMTAFNMPKILLGGSSDSYVKASAEAAMKTYADMFIDPMLSYVDENLTQVARMHWERNLVVKHDSLSPADVEGVLAYNKGYASLGALTINEIRTSQDYDALDYELAKVPILNVGGAAIRLDNGEQLGAIPNNRLPQGEVEDTDEDAKGFESDYRDMMWKQFDKRYQRQAKLLSTKVNEYFDGQQKRLLEILNKKSIEDITLFFDSEAEYLIFKNLLEMELLRIMREGYSYSSIKPGTPFNASDDFVQRTIISIVEKARSVNDTTKSQLINYIKDRANLSNSELALLVKEKFQDIKPDRVKLVVTTTVTSGMNAGLLKAFKDAGAKYKIWLSMRDTKVRDSHKVADNQKVGINEQFNVNGVLLDFPGDPNASVKEVAGCRCTILGGM